MPFLIPALASATCDALILFLSYQEWKFRNTIELSASELLESGDMNGNFDHDFESSAIYKVSYLAPLAAVRLSLLLFPLPYHSYKGTAVKCPVLYQSLYIGTVTVVLLHMLCLSMLDPDSLTAFMEDDNRNGSKQNKINNNQIFFFEERELCWIMLTLSIISVGCHLIMFGHVRSTAPPHHAAGDWFTYNKKKKRILFYYASRKNLEENLRKSQQQQQQMNGHGNKFRLHSNSDKNFPSPMMSPLSNESQLISPPLSPASTINTSRSIRSFSSQYDDFLLEIQTRFQVAKKEWTKRLDDFTNRLAPPLTTSENNNAQQDPNSFNNRMGSPGKGVPQIAKNPLSLAPLTPFRVLLQLFAYEEVLDNGKLNFVFEMDDGIAMTFFVPQLLSFLLHGAYRDSSPKLEQWILDKCRENIHFAHRCFWFLRSWCLEVPTSHLLTHQSVASSLKQSATKLPASSPPSSGVLSINSTASNNTNSSIPNILQLENKQHSFREDDTFFSCKEYDDIINGSLLDGFGSLQQQQHSRHNSRSSIDLLQNSNSQKFLPEERAVIEDLILRVIECGEESARFLQFGYPSRSPSTGRENILVEQGTGGQKEEQQQHQEKQPKHGFNDYDNYCHINSAAFVGDNCFEEDASTSASLTQELVDSLPVDPSSGFPSTRHLESVIASKKYGFLPLHEDHDVRHGNVNLESGGFSGDNDYTGYDSNDCWFQQTPRFLDALISLADGLFLVPREERATDLKKKLQALEVEFLPSNSVYVPIGVNRNNHHRVWRIVTNESIALNTKERVPCIICLEVVNYSLQNQPNANAGTQPQQRELSLDVPSIQQHTSKLQLQQSHLQPHYTNQQLPHFPYQHQKSESLVQEEQRQKQQDNNVEHVTPSLNFLLPYQVGASESEILSNWRFGCRDPHRRDKFIDKVTNSMMGSINKMHIDRVKSTMREGINRIRDDFRDRKPRFQEMLCLKVDENKSLSRFVSSSHHGENESEDGGSIFLTPDDSENEGSDCSGASANKIVTTNFENGAGGGFSTPPRTPPPSSDMASVATSELRSNLNQNSCTTSIVSMGQWYSPTPSLQENYKVLKRRNSFTNQKGLVRMRRKLELVDGSDSSSLDVNRDGDSDLFKNEKSLDYGSNDVRQAIKPVATCTMSPAVDNGDGLQTVAKSTVIKDHHKIATGSKPPIPVVFRENWQAKEARIRKKSAYGSHPGWRLLPILIKANDDLRQEQLASQVIYRMAYILARERVRVWLCPYEIIAVTDRGGIIEAIPDTISLDSLKRNHPNFTNLHSFFLSFFGSEDNSSDALADAKANFVESLAAYSIVCYLLQIKDRHNGNILLDNRGHIIHIDFGFFFLSSPGKNTGFESAPFKLTRDFVDVMDGPESHMFRTFRELCCRTFIALRRHCMEIILLVEMLKTGNEDLTCFCGRPDDAIKGLRERFRLDLSDRGCKDYVNSLVDESLENWRTNWYDRYQRYCVGVL